MDYWWISIRQASIYWIATTILIGCATSAAPQECTTTYTGTFTEEDKPHIELARKGCVRKYGEGACLVNIRKKAPFDYHATCRRAK